MAQCGRRRLAGAAATWLISNANNPAAAVLAVGVMAYQPSMWHLSLAAMSYLAYRRHNGCMAVMAGMALNGSVKYLKALKMAGCHVSMAWLHEKLAQCSYNLESGCSSINQWQCQLMQ
jgi:hypothetical protein